MTSQVTANLHMGPQSIFPLGKIQCFVEKVSLLCSEQSAFCIKKVPFMSPKVSVLKTRGHFFYRKVSGKGSLLILENDHMSSLLQVSSRTRTHVAHDFLRLTCGWMFEMIAMACKRSFNLLNILLRIL